MQIQGNQLHRTSKYAEAAEKYLRVSLSGLFACLSKGFIIYAFFQISCNLEECMLLQYRYIDSDSDSDSILVGYFRCTVCEYGVLVSMALREPRGTIILGFHVLICTSKLSFRLVFHRPKIIFLGTHRRKQETWNYHVL